MVNTYIEISAGLILVSLLMLIWRWLVSRMDRMDKDRKKELFRESGRTNYMLRDDCEVKEASFCRKVDEIKDIMIKMDKNRELAKDEYHYWQSKMGERLSVIEAKIEIMLTGKESSISVGTNSKIQ